MTHHVLSMTDLSPSEVIAVLDRAERSDLTPLLVGRGVALIFEHPSARTRNAAELSVFQLGGHPVTIRGEEIGIDRRESAEDIAATLSGYHALLGARVARHATLLRFASSIDALEREMPVVNLLSDHEHPTQALADLLTIRQEFGDLTGVKIAFIGDANNVARSLAIGAAQVGAKFSIASPSGFKFHPEDIALVASLGGEVEVCATAKEAAAEADVLYTDVWISMGEEEQAEAKRAAFAAFTIDEELLTYASARVIVMHCLPAHRGEEVTASVIDGPRSRIWEQAENRMHAMRGLWHLLCDEGSLS